MLNSFHIRRVFTDYKSLQRPHHPEQERVQIKDGWIHNRCISEYTLVTLVGLKFTFFFVIPALLALFYSQKPSYVVSRCVKTDNSHGFTQSFAF